MKEYLIIIQKGKDKISFHAYGTDAISLYNMLLWTISDNLKVDLIDCETDKKIAETL